LLLYRLFTSWLVPPYSMWQQVAGHFDGDGTISFSDVTNRPFKLGLSLIDVDQSVDQITTVRSFLLNHGFRTSNVLKSSKGSAWMVAVSEFSSVRETLRGMGALPLQEVE